MEVFISGIAQTTDPESADISPLLPILASDPMKRRKAIQMIAAASAAVYFLPACSANKAADQFVDGKLLLNNDYLTYLAKISESILPVHGISDRIPNAVTDLMTMLNDCRSLEEISAFAAGFDQFMARLDAARTNLIQTGSEEIARYIATSYAEANPPAEMTRFLELTRELSIDNLLNSEYYMTEYKGYLLIPEPYLACVKTDDHG